jgi:transcriptional regulator with XRE-family HTH domain
MITLEQIRAARGLLNWSQSALAQECGISVTAMNNIDRGLAVPRSSTLDKIQTVLEENGVEFTEGKGVRMRDELFIVHSYKGPDAIIRYMKDVVETLKKTGDVALHMLADERSYFELTKQYSFVFKYFQDFRKYGLHEYILTTEGIMERYGPPDCATYKWCSPELTSQIGTSIYGNKYCIFLEDRIVVIENPAIVEAYRAQFMQNWKRARPMPPAKSQFEIEQERLQKRKSK